MKKYLSLSIAAILGTISLFYFNSQGRSSLAVHHEEVLNLFMIGEQGESALETDILKARNYLLLTYDEIVGGEENLEKICASLKSDAYTLYNRVDAQLDHAIDLYCASTENLVLQVENFKSKNAVFRNSVYFLHGQTIEQDALLDSNRKKIVSLTLAYALLSSPQARTAIEATMQKIKNLSTIEFHIQKVLSLKEQLDASTREIISDKNHKALEDLRTAYFKSFDKAEDSAARYRMAVFAICFCFFLFAIFSVLRLWNAASSLKEANANLETRVKERTKELLDSQATIEQQQHSIIAAAKTSALGEMAGQAAHEINTPLGTIVLTTEFLKSQLEEDAKVDPLLFSNQLDLILKVASKVARIINSMRKLAGQGGNDVISSISVQSLMDDTLLLCDGRFKKEGIKLEVSYAEVASREIECMPSEVSQILVNLLNNARDAVSSNREKWVRLSINDENDSFHMSVTDSGAGISAENQLKLFTPNFTTKSLNQGTGFGLSISRKIAERHGGKLSLDSENANTSFSLKLPWKQSHALIELTKAG
jgi:C4-dicarboxylate-specific signal transduction histidine kinase